ncbi:hypothetical protein G3I40_11140 [Streptomyces sp. SID14478]|uniref:hypothetical protein n=1 Tax=Streptomyces sp. SID14478 TaxID=2706073 RepID=UPI0013DCF4EC|nr:hypothetical protein [Streptomyces sp. SID14478]NEB75780.1 hypothetical protein [Streptomyces sp. SID14478]
MNRTARATLTVLTACIAAAAASTPALAAGVPVEVPLDGVESALHVDAPRLSTEAPIPMPGTPVGPQYSADHVLPQRALPQLPLSSELPATDAKVPLPQLLATEDVDRLGLTTEGSDVRTLTPGASVNPPLTGPRAHRFGLPEVAAPQAAFGAPDVQAQPGADLAVG